MEECGVVNRGHVSRERQQIRRLPDATKIRKGPPPRQELVYCVVGGCTLQEPKVWPDRGFSTPMLSTIRCRDSERKHVCRLAVSELGPQMLGISVL